MWRTYFLDGWRLYEGGPVDFSHWTHQIDCIKSWSISFLSLSPETYNVYVDYWNVVSFKGALLLTPWPGALPLDPTGGFAPRLPNRLALNALAIISSRRHFIIYHFTTAGVRSNFATTRAPPPLDLVTPQRKKIDWSWWRHQFNVRPLQLNWLKIYLLCFRFKVERKKFWQTFSLVSQIYRPLFSN